jgi:hypothetical protein
MIHMKTHKGQRGVWASQYKEKKVHIRMKSHVRNQGIKGPEPNDKQISKHTYAQRKEAVDQPEVGRAQSISATALQWQIHVRRYQCEKKKMRSILHAKIKA